MLFNLATARNFRKLFPNVFHKASRLHTSVQFPSMTPPTCNQIHNKNLIQQTNNLTLYAFNRTHSLY